MVNSEDINREIRVRLAAIEFHLRQLYAAQFKNNNSDPLESALATQGSAMMGLKRKLEALPNEAQRELLTEVSQHISRIYEELVQGFEKGKA